MTHAARRERDGRGGMTVEERECNAGIDGGCGACELCDPEWWERLRVERASRMTVEECSRWARRADLHNLHAHMAQRDVASLRYCAGSNIIHARRMKAQQRFYQMRRHVFAWALCRAAIRAIENERGQRCSG